MGFICESELDYEWMRLGGNTQVDKKSCPDQRVHCRNGMMPNIGSLVEIQTFGPEVWLVLSVDI